ncbi:MAG TPA: hypothetical protein VGX48_07510 [Pyrinomonadaceae bacterium]|jgi:hypothetical protein|nr:hypothetical protein [Pyrinomonadaceae bacterium]
MNFRLSKVLLPGLVLALVAAIPAHAQRKGASCEDRNAAARERGERERLCVTISPRYEGSGGSGTGEGSGYGGRGGADKPDKSYSSDAQPDVAQPGGGVTAGGGAPLARLTGGQRQSFLNDIIANGGFTKKVVEGKGQVAISIAEDLRQYANGRWRTASTMFLMKTPDGNGHHYLAFNYLGHNLSPEQIWGRVTQAPDLFFPVTGVRARNGRAIAVGNEYDLLVGGANRLAQPFEFPVVVTAATPYTFTFTTKDGHWLRGSATHGVVRDATGAVWLFQEGVGVRNEPEELQVMNYAAADSMWALMGHIVRSQMADSAPNGRGYRYRRRL